MNGAAATEMRRAERPGAERLQVDLGRLRLIRPWEYAIRFGFGFPMSVIAAVIGELAGPRVGGLFLAFPAILVATVTLVEKKEGVGQAATDVRGATFGAIGLIAFAVVVSALVDRSPSLALVGALLAWIVVSGVAYLGVRGLLRVTGERQYLPEIPTSDAATLVGILIARGMTVATADSLTGGTLSALVCSVPDARRVFRAGLVAPIGDLTKLPRPISETSREVAASRGGRPSLNGHQVDYMIERLSCNALRWQSGDRLDLQPGQPGAAPWPRPAPLEPSRSVRGMPAVARSG
ncbi:MAG: DUF3147 family protein [Candidatus Dormibacteria bacterium]